MFTGRPNPNLSLRPKPPAFYDSAKSKAAIDWLAKGPVRADVRAQHALALSDVRDPRDAGRRLALRRSATAACSPACRRIPTLHPANIKEGYWFSLAPSFQPTSVLRDFPFGVEPTKKRRPSTP